MHVLSSPIQYIKLRRTHTQQKRTALHMLAVSGVVRPSHIELRYATPITRSAAFRAQSTAIRHQQTHPIPLPSWDRNTALTMKQTRQWASQPFSCHRPICEKADRISMDQAVRP